MNPGATIRSEASITFLAPVVTLPISAIWPLATATSARYRGAPVPSTTVPFLMSKSYDIANLLSCGCLVLGVRCWVKDLVLCSFFTQHPVPSTQHPVLSTQPLDYSVSF